MDRKSRLERFKKIKEISDEIKTISKKQNIPLEALVLIIDELLELNQGEVDRYLYKNKNKFQRTPEWIKDYFLFKKMKRKEMNTEQTATVVPGKRYTQAE